MIEEPERWEILKVNKAYSISTHGRIKNNLTGRIIAQNNYPNHGDLVVALNAPGRGNVKNYRVKALMRDQFMGEKPSPKMVVINSDGNKYNNKLNNLLWSSFSDAMKLKKRPINKCKPTPVDKIDREAIIKLADFGFSSYQIANMYGVRPQCIRHLIQNARTGKINDIYNLLLND